MVTPAAYRPYVDAKRHGHTWDVTDGITISITGVVVDGPIVEYDNGDIDDLYRDRMDSFTLRVRHGHGFWVGDDFDLPIFVHTDNQECDLPPRWLAHLRLGSLVRVQLSARGIEDLIALSDEGREPLMAYGLRVIANQDGPFPEADGAAPTATESPLRQMTFDEHGRISWQGAQPARDQDAPDGHCWRCGAELEAEDRADGETLCSY
jgi:hypothetical protein